MENEKSSINGVDPKETKENLQNTEQKNLQKAEKIIEEKDRGSKFRKNMPAFWTGIVAAISIIYVLYHIYTSGFGMPMAYKHRVIHLAFVLTLVFLLFPARKGAPKSRPSVVDLVLAGCAIGTAIYMYSAIDKLALRAGVALPMDYLVGFIGMLLVFEACRRVLGYQLLGLAVVLLLYAYFGKYIPGVLSHQGYSIKRLVYQMYLTTQGIFGIPLGVSAQYMVLFVFFASILAQSGVGKLFNDVAMSIAGRSAGGPAKVAVISSGLMGMVQGGAAANVATTGALTIPLMRRVGYKPYYAASIEAAASTGGQIMPPIMGSVAFIMAEFTGISYIRIAAAAVIPAVLYFLSVFFVVDFRARKVGLKGLDESDIPDYKTTIKEYSHMILPMIQMVYLLLTHHTPMYSAFYALITTLVLAYLKPATRMNLKKLYVVMTNAARSSLTIAVAMATAGIVVGVLTITSLGLIVADNIIMLSGGNMFIVLVLTMFVCIILGMGLPTSACYIIAASIALSILRSVGIATLSAHMFILYFAVLSTVTPPVALSSYVAAGIANANPNKVGWTALRLAAAGFIIPYFFVYSPAMLLIADTKPQIVVAAITGLAGVYFLAAASESYFFGKAGWVARLVLLGAAFVLLKPGITTDLIGFGMAVFALAIVKWGNR